MKRVVALSLSFVLMACASGPDVAEYRVDTSGRRDSIAAVAAASMTENHVIGLLAYVHQSDSALGSLAAANGGSLNVKEFGRIVFREHRALDRDILEIGEQLGVGPAAPLMPPDTPDTNALHRLTTTGGTLPWDAAYLDYVIAAHESALENTARALAATHRPEVKTFVSRSVPILQKHLDKARSLKKAVLAARPPATRATKAPATKVPATKAPATKAQATKVPARPTAPQRDTTRPP